MLLSVIIIVVVGLTAYFHYVQGFFSATLSAILAAISAALALSYYEPVVNNLLGGKFPDNAPAMMLCILFIAIYITLRTIFDTFVPGNLRLPVLADKIGAGVMGVIAGLFAGGIVAIAAQSLPFGSSVGGFSRYETVDERDVQIPTSGQNQDTFVYGALKDPDLAKNRSEDRHSLYVPADEVLISFVKRVSDIDGSLAGTQPFTAIHPDLPEELFLDNLGIQVGTKFSALNIGKREDVTVPALFTLPSAPQTDDEIPNIRQRNLPAVYTPKPGNMLLVVRTMFDHQATDSDNHMRFSTGSCRLVAAQADYYPVGTLDNGKHLFANALDDFLMSDSDKGADLVYEIPKASLLSNPRAAPDKLTVADGVFLEVKHLARVDLSGKKIVEGVKPSANIQVYRKPIVLKAANQAPPRAGGETSAETANVTAGPLTFDKVETDFHLPNKVNTGAPDKTLNNFQTLSATGSVADGRFTKLEVNGTESLERMSAGAYALNELGAPAGQSIVKAHFTIASDNPWAFASQLANYQFVDDKDQKHAPNGVVATLKTAEGGDRLVARYNSTTPLTDLPQTEGRPTDVYLYFVLPSSTHLKSLNYKDQPVTPLDLTVQ
ncbi:MAG TPA: hypothetical protein VFE58_14390 [Tepidisphaeraceae bacterium]|jgi:uncharacterized membrane protein required for colicin V production|nr:hypothetical protein [Tepidisphaeraceae bacterium]